MKAREIVIRLEIDGRQFGVKLNVGDGESPEMVAGRLRQLFKQSLVVALREFGCLKSQEVG